MGEVLEDLDSMSLDPLIPGTQLEADSDFAPSPLSSTTAELDEMSESLELFISKINDTREYPPSDVDTASPTLEHSSKTNNTDEYLSSDADTASPVLEHLPFHFSNAYGSKEYLSSDADTVSPALEHLPFHFGDNANGSNEYLSSDADTDSPALEHSILTNGEYLSSDADTASPALQHPSLANEEYLSSDAEMSPFHFGSKANDLSSDVDRASPAPSKPHLAEPEVTKISSAGVNEIWKPNESDFPHLIESGHQSASNFLQLLVFGKEVVRVDVSTGVPGVITELIPMMNFGIGSRAACTDGGKVYFIANMNGNDFLLSYDPALEKVSIAQGGRWDNTKSLTSHNNLIYSCGKRMHKIDLINGRSTLIDTKDAVHSTVVSRILYFTEIGGILKGGSTRLWARHLSDPNERLRFITLLRLNIVALFVWENRLCSLSVKGEITELDMQSGKEVRILSEDGGSPSTCAVSGNSLFIVEISGKLREVNLVTGVGKIIRHLQDVGRNVKSMVVI